MPAIRQVTDRVLKRIVPSASEAKATALLAEQITSFIKKKFDAKARQMGSSARGTDMAGDKDIDIFVFFATSVPREKLEKEGLEIGRAVFKKFGVGKSDGFVIDYAEHPYTKGTISGFRVEVVPAYEVKDAGAKISAVDRTPFHNEFVKRTLKGEQRNEVRLLKKFLDAAGCYGSDLKTQGFAGYLCELLVIRYGSFDAVLRAMQLWTFQQYADIEAKHYPEEHARLKKQFAGQPLIFIDPVDKNRNVAAVVSRERLAHAIFSARQFLRSPSEKFFFPPPARLDMRAILRHVKGRNTHTVVLLLRRPQLIDDILYPQLRKFQRALLKTLAAEDFQVLDSWVFADAECGVALELLTRELPRFKVVRGPPVFGPIAHQDAFVKKYRKVWLIDDRFVAEVERDETTIEGFLASWLSGSAKALELRGVPSEIAKAVAKSFKLSENLAAIKSEEFWRGLEKERVK